MELQHQASSSPQASRSPRQSLRINTTGLRPKQPAAIPIASPTASPSPSPTTSAPTPDPTTASPNLSPASPPTAAPTMATTPAKLSTFDRLPSHRLTLPNFTTTTPTLRPQPTSSALLRSCAASPHHALLACGAWRQAAMAVPFHAPGSLAACTADAMQATSQHPSPSAALFSLSSVLQTAAAQTGVGAVGGAAVQAMPRRPREGEVSRFGALGMEKLCPALLIKSAARAVWPPLRRARVDDDDDD